MLQKMQQNKEVTNNKVGGLKRQPTKYPHGLGISVQTINDERLNYSRASTLRSSKQQKQYIMSTNEEPQLSIIGGSEHLKELQVRRFKYPLTGSYYLDTQETHKATSPFEFLSNIKPFCTRRNFRLFLVFVACILLCFGLISYCIWLHNISLARAKFKLQIEQEQLQNDDIIFFDDNHLEYDRTSEHVHDFEKHLKENIATEPTVQKYETNTTQQQQQQQYIYSTNNDELLKTHRVHDVPKVSPTIPSIPKTKPTKRNNIVSTPLDSRCFSTSLEMCQGVLDYDLTYNSSINLDLLEFESINHLIQSNCSPRAIEFICVTLQPECRPTHIGALPACRRVCKAVLEACSEVIANYDTLISLFDCSLYPDSIDPQKCEDPSRKRPDCYENEFQCNDNTCIPRQWQCDNIKDCAQDEDETSCLICENQDEFRCHSNDKCIPEASRCDQKEDCFDGSDEDNCEEIGSGEESALDEVSLNSFARIFSYASFLLPNETDEGPLTYVTTSEQDTNQNSSAALTGSASNSAEGTSKGFVNFRDSKEIMITSDSETKYKYSAAARFNRTTTKYSVHTTPLQPAASELIDVRTEPPLNTVCASHELRCISGHCITVDQLCDKIMDCPDGADELMCVYKNHTPFATSSTTPSTTTKAIAKKVITKSTTSTTRSISARHRGERTTTSTTTVPPPPPPTTDKRTIRTTIKRKVKTR